MGEPEWILNDADGSLTIDAEARPSTIGDLGWVAVSRGGETVLLETRQGFSKSKGDSEEPAVKGDLSGLLLSLNNNRLAAS